jgi:PadR family transcriptional regulator PadR
VSLPMDGVDWHSELTRAALPRAVLAVLAVERQHGYALIDILKNHGFERIKGGTLYPLVKRLEDQGLVDHVWEHDDTGPGRKVFALTARGARELDRAMADWNQMSATLSGIRASRGDTP